MSHEDWFRTAFGADYSHLYAHRNEDEARALVELVCSRTKLAAGARVLDAPCGAGRHMRAFADKGFRCTGLDLSGDLLHQAAQAPSSPNGSASYLRCDIRQLPFRPEQFDLVTNLFSSFGYFSSEAENAEAMAGLGSMVKAGGYLVVDFMNAELVEKTLQPRSERRTTTGWTVTDERWIDGESRRVNKRTVARSSSGEEKVFYESVRLYTPKELESFMSRAGLQIEEKLGNYSGDSWEASSPRVILIGQKQ